MRMTHFWNNFYQVRAKLTINVKENEGAIKYGQSRDIDNIGSKTQNGGIQNEPQHRKLKR